MAFNLETMGKGRDITFDIMKGIGILLVITCHFFGWNHPQMARIIQSFHMPLFFIVAGYFSKSYVDIPSTKENIKRFFSRLYPPMAVTQFLIVAWVVLMVFANHDQWDSVVRESLSLFWADPDGPVTPWGKLRIGVIWFLLALFVAKSLLIPLSRLKLWAIPVSLVLAWGALLIHRVFPYSIWCISLGLMALPFVTVGWWIRNHPFPVWLNILAIGGWIVAILYSELDMYSFIWGCFPLDIFGAYGGTYLLYLISKWMGQRLKYTSQVLAFFGIASLAIMCVHCFEIASHLGNHTLALIGMSFPVWAVFVWRYILTIGVAVILLYIPGVKRLFV